MQDISHMNELNLSTSMIIILTKLPYKLREQWRKVSHDLQGRFQGSVCFSDIVDFIERQGRMLEDPLFGNIKDVLTIGGRNLNAKLPGTNPRSSFATTVTATRAKDSSGK